MSYLSKYFSFLILFSLSSLLFGQSLSAIYKITYKTGRYKSLDLDAIKDEKMKHQIKKVSEIEGLMEYELFFNDDISVFKLSQNNQLDKNSPYVIIAESFKETVFATKKSEENIRFTIHNSEGFSSTSKQRKKGWIITGESKIIKGYTCYKAVQQIQLLHPLTKEKNQYNAVVWFTYDIPYPFGPHLLNGLPGIVLEGSHNGESYYTAINITNVANQNIQIALIRGKEISEAQYTTLLVANFRKRLYKE